MPRRYERLESWQVAVRHAGDANAKAHLVRLQRTLLLLTLGAAVRIGGRNVRLGGVVQRMPVDTGRARSSVNLSYGSPDVTVPPAGAARYDWQGKLQRNLAQAQRAVGTVGWVVSALAYMPVLEYGLYPPNPVRGTWDRKFKRYVIRSAGGYSKQAPHGMFRVTRDAILDALRSSGQGRFA